MNVLKEIMQAFEELEHPVKTSKAAKLQNHMGVKLELDDKTVISGMNKTRLKHLTVKILYDGIVVASDTVLLNKEHK